MSDAAAAALAAVPARRWQRLDPWQRCLRHLLGVSLRGLGAPADLHLELHAPPPPAAVHLALRASASAVHATLAVSPPPSPPPPPLYTSAPARGTANPTWTFDPLPLGADGGALRAVRLRVRAGGATLCDHLLVFAHLAHLVTDLAFPPLLPAATPLLHFDDGLCVARAALAPLAAAGLLLPSPPRPPAGTRRLDAARLAASLDAAVALRRRLAAAEAENAAAAAAMGAALAARAAARRRAAACEARAAAARALAAARDAAAAAAARAKARLAAAAAARREGEAAIAAAAAAAAARREEAAAATAAAAAAAAALRDARAAADGARRRLVRQAAAALPLSGGGRWRAVCGLRLPLLEPGQPLALGGGEEEEASAALGVLAQLVASLARALGVCLRYPLRLHSSRSAVIDPSPPPHAEAAASARRGAAVLPLYARGVESGRLHHAILLLGRDVQQLLWAVGAPPEHPPWHLIPALQLLVARAATDAADGRRAPADGAMAVARSPWIAQGRRRVLSPLPPSPPPLSPPPPPTSPPFPPPFLRTAAAHPHPPAARSSDSDGGDVYGPLLRHEPAEGAGGAAKVGDALLSSRGGGSRVAAPLPAAAERGVEVQPRTTDSGSSLFSPVLIESPD
ncbi:hypothetical protein AB1Y20_021091 [Prymnesium parvum]|uniref:Autophagy protein 5 n=1 Tax=Prymnesium parvum TaxID=97485 RepID=A0AB34JJE8_PRYPA